MPDSANVDRTGTSQGTDECSTGRSVLETLDTPAFVRGFCTLGVLLVLGDLVTTVYGLELGLREQNPFVLAVLTQYGVAGLVGLKLFALGWVVVIWRWLGRHYGIAAMAGLMVPQGVAVVLNVATILSA